MATKLYGTGVDIVEVRRMEEAMGRWGKSFMNRVFAKGELKSASKMRFPGPHLAARFAAKEAVRKAFGDVWDKHVRWTDIEVVNHASGRPTLKFYRAAKRLRDQERISSIWLSLSHTRSWAVAHVVMECEGKLHWPP